MILQGREHAQEVQVPGVESNARICCGQSLVPGVNSRSVFDGNLEFGEEFAEDCDDLALLDVDHGVVEIVVLVAGDVGDVDWASVGVVGVVALDDHGASGAAGVVIVVSLN